MDAAEEELYRLLCASGISGGLETKE